MITPNVIIETGLVGTILLAGEAMWIGGRMFLRGRWKLSTATAKELATANATPPDPAPAVEVFPTIPETAEPTALQRAS